MAAAFSTRTGWDTKQSTLAAAIRTAREAGQPLIDLTISNPTVCGFEYDDATILGALANAAAMTYDPDARGIPAARMAVAAYYRDHGAEVDPGNVVLTTSTSEAYSYLLRLLCNDGDEVLAAQPSYPLFDYLADLEDVRLRSYPLFYDFGWCIDHAELERRITPRTRAILLVHPNNPTGHATRRLERQRLEELCLRHNLTLIADEVFLDYGIAEPVESFAHGPHPVLTFVVSGLSKICGLPQMKAAWLAGFGPQGASREAMARLEIVADTFLSMNAPVQHALPVWLAGRGSIQRQILDRVGRNLAMVQASGIEVLAVEAGWSAILRLPQVQASVEELIAGSGVIVHPGSFYGISEANRVIISLLGETAMLAEGLRKLKGYFEPTESIPFDRSSPR
jgi:aspartate/methionine/tyrosine aminotransferase